MCLNVCISSYFGWKSWIDAIVLDELSLFRMIRDALNRKSSNSCWIREGPAVHEQEYLFTSHPDLYMHITLSCLSEKWLTELLFLIAAEGQQGFNEAQVSGQQDVVGLTGLQLTGPSGLKIIKPAYLVLQHGRRTDLKLLHFWCWEHETYEAELF